MRIIGNRCVFYSYLHWHWLWPRNRDWNQSQCDVYLLHTHTHIHKSVCICGSSDQHPTCHLRLFEYSWMHLSTMIDSCMLWMIDYAFEKYHLHTVTVMSEQYLNTSRLQMYLAFHGPMDSEYHGLVHKLAMKNSKFIHSHSHTYICIYIPWGRNIKQRPPTNCCCGSSRSHWVKFNKCPINILEIFFSRLDQKTALTVLSSLAHDYSIIRIAEK